MFEEDDPELVRLFGCLGWKQCWVMMREGEFSCTGGVHIFLGLRAFWETTQAPVGSPLQHSYKHANTCGEDVPISPGMTRPILRSEGDNKIFLTVHYSQSSGVLSSASSSPV